MIAAPPEGARRATRWLPWLLGLASVAAVVFATLHVSEAAAFAALLEQADPPWFAAALALQAATYLAQAQVWRNVVAAGGHALPLGAACRLSVVKLLVDQALPSSGLSGSVAIAGALQRAGIPERVAVAGMLVSASSYAIAYAVALVAGLALLAGAARPGGATVAAALAFVAAAVAGVSLALRTAGRAAPATATANGAQPRWRHWLARPRELLAGADPALARSPRLLAAGTACQLAIVALDGLTVWTLIRALGADAPVAAVLGSFVLATLLRTISIVPGGLGAFEAMSVLALHGAGVALPVALAATLMFRVLSFWLPMLPGALLARSVLHSAPDAGAGPDAGAAPDTGPPSAPPAPYWSRPAADVLRELGSAPGGLASPEAARRLRLYGANELRESKALTALRLFGRQFRGPLVLVLLAGAAVSLVLKDWLEAWIILAIVAGSALLGFSQEYRAGEAVAALRRRLALRVTTLRDGTASTVPASAVVPGDVVMLSAGSLVPADGLVLQAQDFLVSEASLTGESLPTEKEPGIAAPDAPLARRSNCVYLGTSVRSGTATVLVVRTGRGTAFGAIAARAGAVEEETEFARGLRGFGHLLMRTVVLVMLLVIAANELLGRPALESLMFAVALSVGLTPELLPAIVSVTLSRGARAMAGRGVIVRRLEAIENLGSIDVLCTDKTGTLTEGSISLEGAVDPEGRPSAEVDRLAFLNAWFESGIANPIDAAIVAAGEAAHRRCDDVRKVDEIPYDFSRKRLTIVVQEAHDARHLLITKGAVDNVLAVCAIEPQARARCEAYYRRMSDEGCRVLAVAVRRVPARPRYAHEDERDLALAGFLLLRDRPKPGVAASLADLAGLGIATKVISGDNRYIAAHVAREVGLDGGALLTGAQLLALTDEALWSLAPRTDVFAEVDPQQKERIVRALQHAGHAVGYLGDGINDVPALRGADVGISVDGAVDAARESADIVLLERDLAVLHHGVQDGRATFANTLKYIGITTSANFGNMISMAVATPLLPFLPLTAAQILLNNFISDLPSIAISTDRVDAAKLTTAQRWRIADVRRFMLVFGLTSTVFDLLTFGLLLAVFHAAQPLFQTAWFVVSLLTELVVVLVLRTEGPAWRSAPSRTLVWMTALAAVAAVALPYVPGAAGLFGFVPLPAPLLGAALAVVVLYVLATEAAKRLVFGSGRAGARLPPAAGHGPAAALPSSGDHDGRRHEAQDPGPARRPPHHDPRHAASRRLAPGHDRGLRQ